MIFGGVAAGVRILLEKGPSRDHILKIRKIPENYIFPEDSGSQKEGSRGARRDPHARVARPAPWPHQPYVRPPWPTSGLAPPRTSSLILLVDVGDQRSLCVVKDQLVGNPKRKV
jgi:hypothetical protein